MLDGMQCMIGMGGIAWHGCWRGRSIDRSLLFFFAGGRAGGMRRQRSFIHPSSSSSTSTSHPTTPVTPRHATSRHAMVWYGSVLPSPVEAPILAYTAEGEVNALEWYQQSEDRNWVGIAFDNKVQILRV